MSDATNEEPVPLRNTIAERIAQRLSEAPQEDPKHLQYAQERERRIYFRRLIDPGMRGVADQQLETSLKMLSTIANNLLKEPDNEKYRRFKQTNNIVKRNLVDVKGAIQYAVEMGFRAEVENFQPWYIFRPSPQKLADLRIGASILDETLERIEKAKEYAKLNRVDQKAVAREIAEKVKLNYEDDRKEKARRDEMDRQVRAARAVAAAQAKEKQSKPGPSQKDDAAMEEDNEQDDPNYEPEKDDERDEEDSDEGNANEKEPLFPPGEGRRLGGNSA